MGSATREALASTRAALAAHSGAVDLATGKDLFEAALVIDGSPQLLAAIADQSADAAAKAALVAGVFSSSVSPVALELLQAVAAVGWSSHEDVLTGIEDLGLRANAISAPAETSIPAELFAFGAAVSSDAQLELALASKLGKTSAKVALVQALLGGKASAQTVQILTHLVQMPQGRRIGELLRHAASVVADQAGTVLATVTAAAPLSTAQVDRLRSNLSARYGRDLTINEVIDPAVVGGVRVQIGSDVIDGSIATRLNDLRLQLAG